MQSASISASAESNRHSSILAANSEKIAKFTPRPSQVAPRGCGEPGHTRMDESYRESAIGNRKSEIR